ncbi:hypothetical protein Aph01nite_19570 [Acrocarpospora phusangensis]|uniref:CopC domain-containing protein n=1 Tax=Acrocarpospora phusangensis TaxID=1070424 RepID=A0A919Q7B6_9ACTN|nr:copper resistance protein CopC [Acrocarpospora phusangensis]GIH23647.1 hypothetical protein Aph01nite_19570 [Acrocarpospora phusangensis]
MRALVTLTAVILALLVGASPASAHDRLSKSTPAKNATVESLESITLTFTARVRFPAMVLRSEAGTMVQLSKPRTEGKDVVAALSAAPPPGKYVVGWRVVSSDGHPIEGEIPFAFTGGPVPAASGAVPAAASPLASAAASSAATPARTADPPRTGGAAQPGADQDSGPAVPGLVWAAGGLLALVGLGLLLTRGRGRGESP